MTDLPENFGENAVKTEKDSYDGKLECYCEGCTNRFFYEDRSSAFCSDECKAKYYGTTVEKLQGYVPKKSKKTLDEWIAYFKSPERQAMYHEQQKSVKIEKKSDGNNVAELMDFLSTPLGEEYARQSTSESK